MPLERYFWHRQPAIDAALLRNFADFIGPGKLVVDVGAGYDPWPYATEFIDFNEWPQLNGRLTRAVDVELQALPYADKQVDFLYCRHTIEDLSNPFLLLMEMGRVAKAGYIEAPSPLAESFCGVDGPESKGRGYPHHRWFVWTDDRGVVLLPKLPIIEQPWPAECDALMRNQLSAEPTAWNTYFAWTESFSFQILRQTKGFMLQSDYPSILWKACLGSIEAARAFGHRHAISPLGDPCLRTDVPRSAVDV